MGGYVDYIKDFPGRILEIYKNYLEKATHDRREVTFLLSLTASGIAVPLYRLQEHKYYPDPFENRKEFNKASKKFDELKVTNFRESELWDKAFEEWQYGKCSIGSICPDSWEKLSSAFIVEEVIRHLRDSLAHGVILTDVGKEIEQIQLFTGKKKEGLRVLLVTPRSLEIFLRKWVEWLQTLDVSIFRG
ncbi:MAG: hypothetical protein ABII09_09300 [Planctomycetota bacterium]